MMQAQAMQFPTWYHQVKLDLPSAESFAQGVGRQPPGAPQPCQSLRSPQTYTSIFTQDFSKSISGPVNTTLKPMDRPANQYEMALLGQSQISDPSYGYGEFQDLKDFRVTGDLVSFEIAPELQEVTAGPHYSPPPSLSHSSDADTIISSPETTGSEFASFNNSPDDSGVWTTVVGPEDKRGGIWSMPVTRREMVAHIPGYMPLEAERETISVSVYDAQCLDQFPMKLYCEPSQPYFQMLGASQAHRVFSPSPSTQGLFPIPSPNNSGYVRTASQTSRLTPNAMPSVPQLPQGCSQRRRDDEFLLEGKKSGMTYKEIRKFLDTPVAESTLRGRFRSLTKARKDRVRKPIWTERDLKLLKAVVSEELDRLDADNCSALTRSQKLSKVSWKKVAEYIARQGGSYHFGNSTCKKKWSELH